MLASVGANRSDLAVIPLTQLIIVMQALRNAEEWGEYFAFRSQLLQLGVQAADETDILIAWMASPERKTQFFSAIRSLRASGRRVAPMISGWHIPLELALTPGPPQDRLAWRSDLAYYSSV